MVWLSLLVGVAQAASLPLTLNVWTGPNKTASIICTGKSWAEVSPGLLQREALLVDLPQAGGLSFDEKLIACDDGSGQDAPVSGVVPPSERFHKGQIVVEGVLRVIVLNGPSTPQTLSSVIFAVNTILGDDALVSKTGKGLIRVDHAGGITVFPPSFRLSKVIESAIFMLKPSPAGKASCDVNYEADKADAAAVKVLHSKLDCAALIQQAGTDAIFAGQFQ